LNSLQSQTLLAGKNPIHPAFFIPAVTTFIQILSHPPFVMLFQQIIGINRYQSPQLFIMYQNVFSFWDSEFRCSRRKAIEMGEMPNFDPEYNVFFALAMGGFRL